MYTLPDSIYADYKGKWENGKKNDDTGRLIVNVGRRDITSPQYYLEGPWKDNQKQGFHKLYPIKTVMDETNAYNLDKINTKKPVGTLYYEDDKRAEKKIEDTIKQTLDDKNIPDDIINNINSYR
jgi:hypothetical protein